MSCRWWWKSAASERPGHEHSNRFSMSPNPRTGWCADYGMPLTFKLPRPAALGVVLVDLNLLDLRVSRSRSKVTADRWSRSSRRATTTRT